MTSDDAPELLDETPPLRLFTALWPAKATRAALAACRDAIHWPAAARPTAMPKLHLTLQFLGAVPQERLQALMAALPPPSRGFELHFGEVQLWRGGLVVLMPRAVPDALLELHRVQARTLRALGLRVETRGFHPHVTLGRQWPRQLAAPACTLDLAWPVRGYALVQSSPDGRYAVLRRYPGAARSLVGS